jgi:hypothetical protein
VTELLLGTRKGLFGFERAGGEYRVCEREFVGVPATAVLADPRDGATYVALDHGHFGVKVHRRDVGGAFAEIATPAYPPKPDDVVDVDPIRKTEVSWTTHLLWTLEAGHADAPDVLWAGTIPGGLFRSDDRGDSWELVRSLWDDPSRSEWFGGGYDSPGIHSISIDPRAAGTMAVGISCGGAWRTTDDGATWTVSTGLRAAFMPPELEFHPYTQDPHRLTRCAGAPDVVWCQHHNGVFRSTDGGATFAEIHDVPPSTFGFAVAAHPTDPGTAWFAPATSDEVRVPVDGRVVVARTRDGGTTFTALGDGLPERDAYHLVYRHGLDVDASGERLAMASTTGSLWVSEDAGDSWQLVTSSLPPVACVRWV